MKRPRSVGEVSVACALSVRKPAVVSTPPRGPAVGSVRDANVPAGPGGTVNGRL